MKFLANENIPLESVKILRRNGIDIISIQELNPGITDIEVINISNSENRIIITFDKDYGDLIYQKKIIFKIGIIFLRFIPKSHEELAEFLIEIINLKIEFQNKFSVIDREKIRQRYL